jgi:tryptophan-rich sensory protein
MKIKSYPRLILSIILIEIIGSLGAIATTPAIPVWYSSLNKPFFTPPSWVFGPVWTSLFFLIGFALYLVWQEGLEKRSVRLAVYAFSIQMILNVLWSFLFFGMQNPLLGFIEIIILWFAILITIFKFYKVSRPAAYMMIPYICWVTIATALNLAVWLLN